ncbi:hypothetical protein D3C81_1906110 [compost metagenome]
MVAAHRVKPWFGKPVERVAALGSAINQVPDTEQAVDDRIEIDRLQRRLQSAEVTVNVTHRKVPAGGVCGEALDA